MTLDPRITFTRAGLGTYFDIAGVLKYGAHNYLLQSQTFDTGWTGISGGTVTANATAAPDGTTTADRLNHVTAGTVQGGGINQQPTPWGLENCIRSVYAKAGSKNWLVITSSILPAGSTNNQCWFNLSTGVVGTKGTAHIASGIEDAGGGWWRCWVRSLVSAVGVNIALRVAEADNNINCTSPGDIYIWGAQAESVTTETAPRAYVPTTAAIGGAPRFDYDPVSHVAKGLLIEEARTNNATDAQNFAAAAWTKTGITVTADNTTAPDGTTTADQVTASATTATVSDAFTTTAAASYTQGIFAKKGTSDWIYMTVQSTSDAVGTPRAWFNLNTGAVGTVEAGITATAIQNVGNGWYRCSAARIGTTGTARIFLIGLCDADNSATVTVGRTAFLWGAQEENAAAFPSSYIPTSGSTATRAADVAVLTGTNFSSWYNASAGTFLAEFDLLAASGTRAIVSADGGTTAEQILLYGSGTDPKAMVRDGSVTQADIDVGTIAAGTTYKLGVSFAANDVAACLNGGTVGTDTSATMPAPTQLRLGYEGTNYLNGHIRKLKFFNVAKTDAELQALTA